MCSLSRLIDQVRACSICADKLVLGPRPIVQLSSEAKVLIIGQAPGRKVHVSGVPWDDNSGHRLREWLGLTPADFYDDRKIALMPMGFCYPGKGTGGDLPPRRECAPLWHDRIVQQLPEARLTLLVGGYAQKAYIANRGGSLADRIINSMATSTGVIALPHPAWRSVCGFRGDRARCSDLMARGIPR